ncbi:hypothetical protein J6590_084226 [Homalodisca vitripennis]|nr:hypothetical protein J6590_084226 [Homalodisca vitripennis]
MVDWPRPSPGPLSRPLASPQHKQSGTLYAEVTCGTLEKPLNLKPYNTPPKTKKTPHHPPTKHNPTKPTPKTKKTPHHPTHQTQPNKDTQGGTSEEVTSGEGSARGEMDLVERAFRCRADLDTQSLYKSVQRLRIETSECSYESTRGEV